MTVGLPHVTVLQEEAVAALKVAPDGIYVDGTFGRGGHSRAILAALGQSGRLLAMDRDVAAVTAGQSIADPRFRLLHRCFADLLTVGADEGVVAVDGVLLDLGVSSPQLEEAQRGFSFRHDAPLDMRMDATQGQTVAEWLAQADIGQITEVIRGYGEERCAFQIAKKIVAARGERPITTTSELAALVRSCVHSREPGQDPATRSFQALRIHINQEQQQLALVLPQALSLLKPGGRLVVISFHSLEDRVVKQFINHAAHPERSVAKDLPLRHDQLPLPTMRTIGRPVRPSAAEIASNPRARSAVMRIAEKL